MKALFLNGSPRDEFFHIDLQNALGLGKRLVEKIKNQLAICIV
jgi:hypothetical protein